jgi:hypothetical protein
MRLYMTEHEELSLSPLTFLTVSATRAASVKASLTPRFFIAEHSVHIVSARSFTLSSDALLAGVP